MNIKENIKTARNEAGFTQSQLANELGVSQKDISRWENGDRTPNIFFLAKICEVLKVSADTLLEINLKK